MEPKRRPEERVKQPEREKPEREKHPEREPARELDLELAPGPESEPPEPKPGHRRDPGRVAQAQQGHPWRWLPPPPARCWT